MTEKVIIAGSGGQGVMLLGKVLAESAMRGGKSVTWFPSYGAEVRGGTAHCMVVVSDSQISSPRIEKADTLIALNAPSLDKFKSRLKDKGLLIINSSLAASPSKAAVSHPFSGIAIKLGNLKVMNMVALGCYLAQKKIVPVKTVLKAIEEMAPPDKRALIEINYKALNEGYKLK